MIRLSGSVSILALILLSGAATADDDQAVSPKGAPTSEQAVRKGTEYLKKRLLGPGQLYYFAGTGEPNVGAAALAGLTLLECGVPASDPAVIKAIEIVRGAKTLRFTYAVAMSVLFLERLSADKKYLREAHDSALLKSLVLRLIAAQHAKGGWGYFCQLLTFQEERELSRELAEKRFRPGSFKVATQFRANYHDNSIAQYVVLALWVARRNGVPVEPSLIVEEQRYRTTQKPDGSWSYNETVHSGRDATTCAGLLGLAIGAGIQAEAGSKDKKGKAALDITKDPAVAKGLVYLSKVIGKKGNLSAEEKEKRHKHTRDLDTLYRRLAEEPAANFPRIKNGIKELDTDALATGILFDADAWGDIHFLWALERVAVVYDLKTIEGKDWYTWGSQVLLKNQQADGSWQERFPGVPDTCFALLFLKRAIPAKKS